ncbi:MAG TPA: ABC transporter substrate-binding protein [Thermodesulfobacteriota bacterium]|nr:ABC transporter substrate-binding protein [Thermodesulfobacteriota bacterium]
MSKTLLRRVIIGMVAGFVLSMPLLSWAQAKGPIKIGLIVPLSGGMAATGKDMLNGFQLYLEEIGYQAAGRKIELIVEDDEAVPATGLTKTRKLVEKDGVHIMTGGLMASTGYALAPYIDSKEIPTTYPIMAPDDLTQRQRAKWIVRTGWNSSQPNHALGEYTYQTLKYKKAVIMGLDYAFGWESAGGFQKTFEDAGGKVIQKIWCPLTVTDFSPYLSQISKDADVVYILFLGRSTLQFTKQYQEFGLKGKLPLVGGGTATDEHALPSMGDEALGIITALHYSEALDNPANKKFVKAFREKAKKAASYYSEGTYTGARWIVEAIKAVKGDVENRGRLMEALKKVELKDVPRGPFKLDDYGNPVQNIYIRKVERVGGELQNTVIHTYPSVSQFWRYKPEEFLKQPVYSREYPPLKP